MAHTHSLASDKHKLDKCNKFESSIANVQKSCNSVLCVSNWCDRSANWISMQHRHKQLKICTEIRSLRVSARVPLDAQVKRRPSKIKRSPMQTQQMRTVSWCHKVVYRIGSIATTVRCGQTTYCYQMTAANVFPFQFSSLLSFVCIRLVIAQCLLPRRNHRNNKHILYVSNIFTWNQWCVCCMQCMCATCWVWCGHL